MLAVGWTCEKKLVDGGTEAEGDVKGIPARGRTVESSGSRPRGAKAPYQSIVLLSTLRKTIDRHPYNAASADADAWESHGRTGKDTFGRCPPLLPSPCSRQKKAKSVSLFIQIGPVATDHFAGMNRCCCSESMPDDTREIDDGSVPFSECLPRFIVIG